MATQSHFYVGAYIIAPTIEDKSISNLHRCSNIICSNFLGLDDALKICPKCSSSAQTEHKVHCKNDNISLKDIETKISKEQLASLLFYYKTSSIKSLFKEIQEYNKPNLWVLKNPLGTFYYSNTQNFSFKEIKASSLESTIKETQEYLEVFTNIFKQLYNIDLIVNFGIIQNSN